jgi:hypothetical protein
MFFLTCSDQGHTMSPLRDLRKEGKSVQGREVGIILKGRFGIEQQNTYISSVCVAGYGVGALVVGVMVWREKWV